MAEILEEYLLDSIQTNSSLSFYSNFLYSQVFTMYMYISIFVQPALASQGQNDGSLPGIGQYKTQIPVKVTNMQLATSPMWNGSIYYDDPSAQDPSQRGKIT